MVLGLSMVQPVGAAIATTPMVLEATGFYGLNYTPANSANTNNTWSPYTSSGTYGTCTTTANNVTITSSNMTLNSSNFKIQDGKSFTISASSSTYIYRIVIKAVAGAQNNLTASNGTWGGSDTWLCGETFWGFTKGKTSVTFTNNYGDNYQINSINVYTYRVATSSEARISATTFTVNVDNEETKNVTLTTSLGTFSGASNPYHNNVSVSTGVSSDNLELDGASASSYSNGSSIDINIYPYTVGTYTGEIILGRQTSSNTADNYHMVSLWIPFTVEVEDACTIDTKIDFDHPADYDLKVGAANFINKATAKLLASPYTATGQTVTYTSSNADVATVNASTGAVTLGSTVGTATITASVQSVGTTYCASENSYDITLSKYNVTYHYPTCAASQPEDEENVSGTLSLPTNMEVDGYRFAGWTDHAVTGDNVTTVTPLYTSTVTVSSDMNLYAVYTKTSSTFTLCDKGTTLTAGEYVFAGSYSVGVTYIMTASLLSSNKLSANKTDYTITDAKTLSCQEEACIWTISGSAGNWTIKNNSTGKYLSATGGETSNSNLRLALVDETDSYSVWTIAQASANTTPFTCTNNKRNTDSETYKKLMGNGSYFGFYSNGTSPYLFRRASASGTYTTNPSCNATEYKVTINQQDGGTVTASASANGTWSDPVLNGMHGSETITITATPDSYHNFSSWSVVSGGASLSSTTNATATFTMPTNDVVIRPVYTPKSYTVIYKDKGNNTYSGDAIASSYNSYTYGTGLTLPEPTKTDYVFMGWYAETDCSGSRVTSISTTDYGNKTFYALWMQYSDPLAWCPEPEVHLTGDNVYITSTNGKSVMAVNTLTLNAINLVPGSAVRLSTPASSGIMFSASGVKYNATTATIDITADAGGDISDAAVYVHYYPTSAGTGTPTDITVTATYQTNTDYYSTKDVHVRNMPSAFAIAVKQGGNWYALPADIASASQPAGVLLDVDETTWTCKGPATLNYTLWPVKSTTGDADLYQSKGEKLRFSGYSNKGLCGSLTTTTVNNRAAITAINSDPATGDEGSYEWTVTTTVEGSTWKYTLDAGTNKFLRYYNASAWGTYASGVNDIYLIPITTVETANISVMEWGENEMALRCAANTTLTSVKIDGTEVTPKPTLAALTGDLMKLSGLPNLSTLATYAMKTMIIEVQESSTAKQALIPIPFILTATNSPAATPKTAIDLRNLAGDGSQETKNLVIRPFDIVIRNGAQLEVTKPAGNATACTFNNLYIYPGGKLNVSDNDLGVQNVYLRGGFSWLDASKDYRLPQMLVASGKTLSGVGNPGNGVYYDLTLDNAMYYMTAFPRDVAFSAITNEEGTGDWTAWIYTYSGKGRTETPKYATTPQWTAAWNGADHVSRGVGYEIAIKPRNSRWYGILRFPLITGAWSEPDCKPAVTAWGMEQYTEGTLSANNVGWNLIGNPFFAAINNVTGIVSDGLTPHLVNGAWDGHYDWTTETHKYYTIFNKMDYDYEDLRLAADKIEPFYPFFVQTTVTGTLSFTAAANRSLKAPTHAVTQSSGNHRELIVDFSLTADNGKHDVAGLTINDDYSALFDLNDKEKSIDATTSKLKLYTVMDGYRIAFNALPEAAITEIPLGYLTATAGDFTIALSEHSDLSYFEQIIIVDNEEQLEWDLLQDAYVFSTDAMPKGNDTRFTLRLKIRQQADIGTDIGSQGELSRLAANGYDGTIVLHGLPDGARVYVYDMTGKLLYSNHGTTGNANITQQAANGRMQLAGLPTGVYNVRVVGNSNAQTIRTIVY